MVVALLLIARSAPAPAADDRTQTRPALERVTVAPERLDVGDGDTVIIHWDDGDRERVRILGIDTPEVAHPQYGMPYDQPFGPEAAAFAAGVFAAAVEVELLRAAETDRYGRTLGYLFVNGRNYSVMVIAAGLATETVTHYGDNGLPAEAAAVLAAAQEAGPVPFDEPYRFRQRMRALEEHAEAHSPE
jgi:endonuclease YncB( thermonuclease family)